MFRVMVFNATFNNISVISWQSVLLMEEMGVPGENHQPATKNRQIKSHDDFYLSIDLYITGGVYILKL
jgi:hypothetical protein